MNIPPQNIHTNHTSTNYRHHTCDMQVLIRHTGTGQSPAKEKTGENVVFAVSCNGLSFL